jgi:hypothetical protein
MTQWAVPDELLDRAAEAFDLTLEALVIRGQSCPHVLGIGVMGRAVKPPRSTNRTETTLRSSAWEGGAAFRGVAHSRQNLDPPVARTGPASRASRY